MSNDEQQKRPEVKLSEAYVPLPKQRLLQQSTANEILFGGSAGGSKALDINTSIPTPNGWTKMWQIEPGDWVFSDDGNPCSVLACSDIMVNHQCYEIVFDDGSRIIADAQHGWMTHTVKDRVAIMHRNDEFRTQRKSVRPSRGNGKKPWLAIMNKHRKWEYLDPPPQSLKTTETLFKTVRVGKVKRVNHTILCARPLRLGECSLPIPAYVLGAWLGDGHSASAGFTSADLPIIEAIREEGYEVRKGSAKYHWGIHGLSSQLRRMGCLNNKHIPSVYLRASTEQRLELLRGLMDTDGTAAADGGCSFTTTSPRLRDGVSELVATLGIKFTCHERTAKIYGRIIGSFWNINFTTKVPCFRLQRKLDRQLLGGQRNMGNKRYVIAVNPVPSVPVRCIEVDAPSGCFLCGKTMIPTHNSHALRWEGLKWCLTIPGLKVYLFRRIGPELEANHVLPSLDEFRNMGGVYKEQKKRWEFSVGGKKSILNFCHCQHEKNVFNYQGAEIHLLLVDESTTFSQFMLEYLRARVRCTLFVPPQYKCRIPGIIYASNPGGLSHAYHKQRFVDYLEPYEIKAGPPDEGGMLRQFIPSSLEDNTHLTTNDPGYAKRLEELPEPYRSAYRDGNWDIFLGQMFNFNVKDHACKPMPVPDSASLYFCFDWGFGKPYWCGWLWVDADDRLYLFSELYGCMGGREDTGVRQADSEIAEHILEHESRLGLTGRPIVRLADPTCWNKKPDYSGGGQGPSTAEVFAKSGIYMNPGDPNRLLKVRQMHERLRLYKDADGKTLQPPMLVAYDTCEAFINTITQLQADPLNPEYWDDRQEDHAVEGICHALMARPIGSVSGFKTAEQAARDAAI